jgi:hypothetical protein
MAIPFLGRLWQHWAAELSTGKDNWIGNKNARETNAQTAINGWIGTTDGAIECKGQGIWVKHLGKLVFQSSPLPPSGQPFGPGSGANTLSRGRSSTSGGIPLGQLGLANAAPITISPRAVAVSQLQGDLLQVSKLVFFQEFNNPKPNRRLMRSQKIWAN